MIKIHKGLKLPKAKMTVPKPAGRSFHPHVASPKSPRGPVKTPTMSVHDVLKKYL